MKYNTARAGKIRPPAPYYILCVFHIALAIISLAINPNPLKPPATQANTRGASKNA